MFKFSLILFSIIIYSISSIQGSYADTKVQTIKNTSTALSNIDSWSIELSVCNNFPGYFESEVDGFCINDELDSNFVYFLESEFFRCPKGYENIIGLGQPVCLQKTGLTINIDSVTNAVLIDPSQVNNGCGTNFVGLGQGIVTCFHKDLSLTLDFDQPTWVHNASLFAEGQFKPGECPRGFGRTPNGGANNGPCYAMKIIYKQGIINYGLTPTETTCDLDPMMTKTNEDGFCVPGLVFSHEGDGSVYANTTCEFPEDYNYMSFIKIKAGHEYLGTHDWNLLVIEHPEISDLLVKTTTENQTDTPLNVQVMTVADAIYENGDMDLTNDAGDQHDVPMLMFSTPACPSSDLLIPNQSLKLFR